MPHTQQELQVVEDVLGQHHLIDHLGAVLIQSIDRLVENGEQLSQQLALLLAQAGHRRIAFLRRRLKQELAGGLLELKRGIGLGACSPVLMRTLV